MGSITARAMFGGWGIYCDGLIFAIVDDDVCYLKADADTIGGLKAAGSAPFHYSMKDGKVMEMAYWRVPDAALEERDELLRWARDALAVSLRAKAAKPPKKTKKI